MRRLLLVLLMLIVPAQAALAAVCGYCDHHTDGEVSHALAHGKFVTQAINADGDSATDDGAGVDCSLCHLGSATIASPERVMPASQLPNAPPMHKASLYHPSHLDRIERVPLVVADSF